jgi:DNA-binding IclR family transcriptional regulator
VLEVGAQLPAYATALGKAILAHAPAALIDDLTAEPLERLTARTLGAAGLREQLAKVRESGIARERDEAVLGESSVAAPIFDHSGHAVGSIGVVGDTERIIPSRPAKGISGAVLEAARGVSRDLGAPRWPATAGYA